MSNPLRVVFRIPELRDKILFTLGMLAVYRLGAHVVVPGVDVAALQSFAGQLNNTLFGIYNMFVGGGLSRATVFALGIMPYISASIVFQLLAAVFPTIERMQKEGPEGRQRLNQYTRYLTVGLAAVQAYGYALFLESVPGAVPRSGWGFRLLMVLCLTTGAVFVMWLGERITERGIGNGMSLLIFFSIVERLPADLVQLGELVRLGEVTVLELLAIAGLFVLVTAAAVAAILAMRRIPIQIPRKVLGRGRIREGQKSFIPIRLNTAGVMPIVFAQSIIVVPGTFATLSKSETLRTVGSWFQYETMPYYVIFVALIILFTYFYTAIVFNPNDLAESLKKQGAFVPGVKPGQRTADYIDGVLSRVSLPGALFLAAVAIVPQVVLNALGVPFLGNVLAGTGLLIVVGVALDTMNQVQQHLLLRRYEGFMRRGRITYRGRQRLF